MRVRPSSASLLQAKLRVGNAGTPAEIQADEVAKHLDDPSPGPRSLVSVSAEGDGLPLSPPLQGQLAQASHHGRPLPSALQADLGGKLGADFGSVRLHDGAPAAQLNRQLGARAFTLGSNIYFGRGEYNPSSPRGRTLLAHELTHTMQQSSGGSGVIQRTLEEEEKKEDVDAQSVEAVADADALAMDVLGPHDQGIGPATVSTANKSPPIGADGTRGLFDQLKRDPAFRANLQALNPSMWARLKRKGRRPTFLLNMIPGYVLARSMWKFRHERRKQAAMESLAKDASGPSKDLTHVTEDHARMKKYVAGATGVLSAAALAGHAPGAALGSLVAAGLSSLGHLGAEAVANVSQPLSYMAVKGLSLLGIRVADRKLYQRSKGFPQQPVNLPGTGNAPIGTYKNTRALLYHLGRAVQTFDELKSRGVSPDVEQAFRKMKAKFGSSYDQNLTQRQQRAIARKGWSLRSRKDWLTAEERSVYDLLKAGKITRKDVPDQMLLPILWQANKLFDYHALLQEEGA